MHANVACANGLRAIAAGANGLRANVGTQMSACQVLVQFVRLSNQSCTIEFMTNFSLIKVAKLMLGNLEIE
jgi:hypothetical protein